MNILFVTELCGYFGGVEQNIAHTVRGLRSRGYSCHLAFGSRTKKDADGYSSLFDSVQPCRELSEESGAESFDDIVSQIDPETIYLHKVPSVSICTSALGKRRVIRMVHDHDLCCPRKHKYFARSGQVCNKKAGWRCWADLAFLERTPDRKIRWASIGKKISEMRRNYALDALLVGSEFMKQELLMNGFPKDRVHIVEPVVDFEDVEVSSVPQTTEILCVAQIIRGKGLDLFLDALAKVQGPFHARIVGTGNAQESLEAQCKDLGLANKVTFEGWVSPSDIRAYYEKARVVAVPSRWPEPFGMVGLEAMNHGRPVVGFAVGGIPDWLAHEESGLLVPEQDVAGFAQALDTILSDDEVAQRLGSGGRHRIEETYGFDRYLDRLTALLSSEVETVE